MAKEKKPRPAHRPLKYGEETETIGPFRVPKSKKHKLLKLIKDFLKELEVNRKTKKDQ